MGCGKAGFLGERGTTGVDYCIFSGTKVKEGGMGDSKWREIGNERWERRARAMDRGGACDG